ncbi:MAG: hypothetical protein BKP49_07085 [Treponema sp. CETP13]|nr:MAG: hypothetical protein BKP49_07085 [Treponema sp. CETP13]
MEGLDPLGLTSLYSSSLKTQKKKENSKTKKSTFSRLLHKEQESVIETDDLIFHEIEGKNFEETLQFLVDSVYSSGDELKKNTSPENFKQYHKSLSGFMRFVVKNSFQVETIRRRRRLSKKQPYQIIQTINKKLDELARNVLSNQRDQMNLLAKIDEINGLVVDIMS